MRAEAGQVPSALREALSPRLTPANSPEVV
jgi:hypothetical protein